MSTPELGRTVEYESVSMSKYDEHRALIAELAGIDVATIKGYALVVDDGSRQAVVTTDLAVRNCIGLLYQVTELLLIEASS